MRASSIGIVALAGAAGVFAVQQWAGREGESAAGDTGNRLTPSRLLSAAESAGFAYADKKRRFEFPDDHGPHPDYRSEWWYFTGNLATSAGPSRHFGFQLTFFRFALAPGKPPGDAAWRQRQVYMAHLAVTDTTGKRFLFDEQLSRAALGLAGAQARPFRVWLGAWEAASAGDAFLPLTLAADGEGFGLRLTASSGKPCILQGDEGLSRKSAEPGNASYYYSCTRLPVTGTVQIGGQSFSVAGEGWLDREWSTSALDRDTEGWDWFALQLDDGSELMFYRLRGEDGSTRPSSAGTLVDRDGAVTRLGAGDIALTPLSVWRGPGGVEYPVAWRLRAPRLALDLTVEPRLENQELRLLVRYWEGAVTVTGAARGREVRGKGYLELAGYAP